MSQILAKPVDPSSALRAPNPPDGVFRWLPPGGRNSWLWPVIFIGPCFLGLIVFTYLPVIMSFALSFSYWNLLGEPRFVGLENYVTVLSDPLFWKTMANTWVFATASVFLEVIVALGFALMLSRAFKGVGIFRTLFFLPVITPMVSVALVWGWLYDPQHGALNAILQFFGSSPIAWLQDPHWAMASVVFLRVWKDLGYSMVILLAGLQGIPESLYESASLDGAGPWRRLWSVTLPMLSPTLFFVITVSMMNAFQAFDAVYLLTEGGPQHATQVLVYWVFQNAFQFYKVGPASAIAYILFIMILAVTMIQWWLRKHWVLYESEN